VIVIAFFQLGFDVDRAAPSSSATRYWAVYSDATVRLIGGEAGRAGHPSDRKFNDGGQAFIAAGEAFAECGERLLALARGPARHRSGRE
jgi:hypothetical protein